MMGGQFILHFADRSARLDQFLSDMEKQIVVDHFHIVDGTDPDLSRAAFYGDRDIVVVRPARLDLHDRAPDRLRKGIITHRFQNIVERTYLISLYGVLRRIGDKNDRDLLVRLSDLSRCRHAVHKRHLNIHENQVITARITFRDAVSVRKFRDLKRSTGLGSISLKKPSYLSACIKFVIYDCHSHSKNYITFFTVA